MAAVVSGAANSRLGGSGKTTNVAPKSSATSTFNTATSAVNNESQDQMYRAQVEYWKTHTASSPDQIQQKYDTYLYAQDHGIAGAKNLDQIEMGIASSAFPDAATRFADNKVPPAQSQARFDAGTARAATPALPGAGETQPVSAGNFYGPRTGNASSGPNFSGVPSAPPSPGLVAGSAGGGSAGGTMSAPMTPEAISAATGMSIGQVYAMMSDPTQAPLVAALGNSIGQRNQNQGYVASTLVPAAANANTAINNGIQAGQNAVNGQYNQVGALQSGYNGLVGQQGGYVAQANAQGAQDLAGYGANLGAATAMQGAAYGQLAGAYGGMSQLAATPYTQNVQAQQAAAQLANYQTAGLAQSSYQNAGLTLANFKDAQYQGYVGTEAQYERAQNERAGLAQASSDSGDVAAERGALGQLTGMAGGSLDTTNGAGSGGGSAAQQSALAQYGALTSPEATAKEKFLYEQQREAQEQQESASRAALMNDYRVRGVGGSGMELGSILQAGQQNSQQRLLGDLGTQAGAVDRSMQALAGYGNLSSQMVAQGNQVNQANMANRLGAAGAQGQLASNIRGQGDALAMYNSGQSNTVGMFNAGQANQTAQFNAGAYNQNQMFNANVENDANAFNANAFNNNQQFNANAYNQNQISNAGFSNDNSQFNANAYNANSMNNSRLQESNNEFNAGAYNSNSQYNAGQVNSINIANAQQSNEVNLRNAEANGIQSRFADSFAAEQQSQAATRAQDLANTGVTVGQNFATNAGSANTAATAANMAAYGRNSDLTHLNESGMLNVANAGTTANNAAGQQADRLINGANANFGNTLAVGNAWMGAGTQGTTAVNTALGNISGDNAAKSAQALASQPGFNFLKPSTWV